ncbi:hypothetical protein PC118_g24697 [Phytophthora cactorum]|uniref:Uncharacterized protein n=1 Tax=Phytophthora cactorum TaxID=29920 RepID=A0A8T1AE42_9STRA|nr:hypothetical protein PC117_g27288 [Phytophthora cactorum]KAG2955843.1 hypothetical protein PC118_g24697 [Phytophthora cactorum]
MNQPLASGQTAASLMVLKEDSFKAVSEHHIHGSSRRRYSLVILRNRLTRRKRALSVCARASCCRFNAVSYSYVHKDELIVIDVCHPRSRVSTMVFTTLAK